VDVIVISDEFTDCNSAVIAHRCVCVCVWSRYRHDAHEADSEAGLWCLDADIHRVHQAYTVSCTHDYTLFIVVTHHCHLSSSFGITTAGSAPVNDLSQSNERTPRIQSNPINASLLAECCCCWKEQEAQLMLTTGSTRLAVSRGQQTWYHSTCNI